MFNNLINYHDITRLIWGVRHGYFPKIISRLTKGKSARVKNAWKDSTKRPSSWWIIPEVSKYYNYLISGDHNIDYYNYIANKYLSTQKGLQGLSLGCGSGHRELKWSSLCDFKKIQAYDLSEARINLAKRLAQEKGSGGIIDYHAADINKIDFQEDYYDVIFMEQSLHHISPLKNMLKKINKSLTSNGYFILNEYVGPSRFQWTERQLRAANGIRSFLPQKYKKHIVDGSTNKSIIRPSRLSMILKDPSEAIESEKIIPLIKDIFDIVEIRPYNGAITHLLFDGIAHNFLSRDEETLGYIQLCLQIENLLTKNNDIQSDFAVAVCQKKSIHS